MIYHFNPPHPLNKKKREHRSESFEKKTFHKVRPTVQQSNKKKHFKK